MPIINKDDIVRFCPVSNKISAEKLSRQIEPVELFTFNQILGAEWYEELIADLSDHSGEPNWTAGTYTAGDIVRRFGQYWVATATTTTEPGEYAEGWTYASKFDTACNESLFTAVLGSFLSFRIVQATLPYITFDIAELGAIKRIGENFDRITEKELQVLAARIQIDCEMRQTNLHAYIANGTGGCSFPLYKPVLDGELTIDCNCELGITATAVTRRKTPPRWNVGRT